VDERSPLRRSFAKALAPPGVAHGADGVALDEDVFLARDDETVQGATGCAW
jgi:hypothetical protein